MFSEKKQLMFDPVVTSKFFFVKRTSHLPYLTLFQGIPGGQAALQRLYQDVQEPLLNSATSTFANNPFATLMDNSENTGQSFRDIS